MKISTKLGLILFPLAIVPSFIAWMMTANTVQAVDHTGKIDRIAYSSTYLANQINEVGELFKSLSSELESLEVKVTEIDKRFSDLEFYQKPDEFQVNAPSIVIDQEKDGDATYLADASQSNSYEIYQSGGNNNYFEIEQSNVITDSSVMYTPDGQETGDSLMNDFRQGMLTEQEFAERLMTLQ